MNDNSTVTDGNITPIVEEKTFTQEQVNAFVNAKKKLLFTPSARGKEIRKISRVRKDGSKNGTPANEHSTMWKLTRNNATSDYLPIKNRRDAFIKVFAL